MKKSIVTLIALALMLSLGAAGPALAAPPEDIPGTPTDNGIQPILVDGNPNCVDLGYGSGYKLKPEGPPLYGPYSLQELSGFPNFSVELIGSAVNQPTQFITISDPPLLGDEYFDWSSDLLVDAVIVKGGNNANHYVYSEATTDGALHAPFKSNGEPREISHIEFCLNGDDTAIILSSFEVDANNGQAVVTWETGTEIDNAGFNLYRATSPDGPWLKVNSALIAAEGDPVSGASYTVTDTPGRGVFYYQLEDLDYFGASTLHEPAMADFGSPVRAPWFRPSMRFLGL